MQQLLPPSQHLRPQQQALEELHDFITSTRKTSPWLIFIRISGLNETWTLASTPAFTYFDTSWFAALSFGVLAPKTIHRFLALEGDLYATGGEVDEKMKSLVAADDLDEDCPSWRRSVNIAELLFGAALAIRTFFIFFDFSHSVFNGHSFSPLAISRRANSSVVVIGIVFSRSLLFITLAKARKAFLAVAFQILCIEFNLILQALRLLPVSSPSSTTSWLRLWDHRCRLFSLTSFFPIRSLNAL